MVTVAILAGYNYLTPGRTASPPIATAPPIPRARPPETAALEIRVVDHQGAPVSGATVRHEGVVAKTNDLGIAKLEVAAAARKPVEVVVAPPNGPEMRVSAEAGIRKVVTLAAPPRPQRPGAARTENRKTPLTTAHRALVSNRPLLPALICLLSKQTSAPWSGRTSTPSSRHWEDSVTKSSAPPYAMGPSSTTRSNPSGSSPPAGRTSRRPAATVSGHPGTTLSLPTRTGLTRGSVSCTNPLARLLQIQTQNGSRVDDRVRRQTTAQARVFRRPGLRPARAFRARPGVHQEQVHRCRTMRRPARTCSSRRSTVRIRPRRASARR